MPFSACRYLDPFLRSKSKLVQNYAKLKSGKILRVQAPKKTVPKFLSVLRGTLYVNKFGEVIPTDHKVIRLNALNCASVFELLLPPIFFGGTHIFGPSL